MTGKLTTWAMRDPVAEMLTGLELEPPESRFVSSVPFEAERVGAAAVYCADGRFGDQMDEFLHLGLGLPRYDRVAVPGGAACLADHIQAMRERSALERQLRFLIEAHELTRVVLIAHQDCGFYMTVRWRAASLESQQFADLARAAERIRSWGGGVEVEAYLARRVGNRVRFETEPRSKLDAAPTPAKSAFRRVAPEKGELRSRQRVAATRDHREDEQG